MKKANFKINRSRLVEIALSIDGSTREVLHSLCMVEGCTWKQAVKILKAMKGKKADV